MTSVIININIGAETNLNLHTTAELANADINLMYYSRSDRSHLGRYKVIKDMF